MRSAYLLFANSQSLESAVEIIKDLTHGMRRRDNPDPSGDGYVELFTLQGDNEHLYAWRNASLAAEMEPEFLKILQDAAFAPRFDIELSGQPFVAIQDLIENLGSVYESDFWVIFDQGPPMRGSEYRKGAELKWLTE